MRIAYFDCFSGISGDMLTGALLDAGLDFGELEKEIDKLGLQGVSISASRIVKQNIASTRFTVKYPEQKHHRGLDDLIQLVENTSLEDAVKEKAKEVFKIIAVAEARIHNMPVEKVHFHEIGAVDTVVDVVAAITGLRKLGIEKVYCSALNVGSGFVTFSHGKFPVPAPATAEILKGVPVYSAGSEGELVTPTGAAVITALSGGFGDMPPMVAGAVGYGAGTKDFEQPNVLRVYLGETDAGQSDKIIDVIETNIDDMNPQFYDHVIDMLYREGALEVFLTNIQMKKNRPGIRITVLTGPDKKERLLKVLFRETPTIGVRIRRESREVLERETRTITTPWGGISAKISWFAGEIVNVKPEYEEMKRVAYEKNMPLRVVAAEIERYLDRFSGKSGK